MERINLTEDMKKRIIGLKRKNKLTYTSLAAELEISVTKLKNIIRLSKGNASIDRDTIIKIAERFGCTEDYLLCESDNPHTNRDGIEKHSAVNFENNYRKLSRINSFMTAKENEPFFESMNYILFESPIEFRVNWINNVNSMVNTIKNTYKYELRKGGLSEEKENFIKQNLIFDNGENIEELINLAKGDAEL